ncbi:MAG: hypothetical protein JWR10_2438 [Rubritepida sp.]|nr:hypothetical protein [Rubritepida sp.]
MAIETGDILYMPGGAGHIGMAYDNKTIIHAQFFGNFHKEPNQKDKGGVLSYMASGAGILVFRPPWAKCPDAAARKATLQRVSDAISVGAVYGAYRAVRLLLGSSAFGPDAFTRLMKYRERYEANKGTPALFAQAGNEVIKNVTCSEAVIVTYQLTFPLHEEQFFVRLDAAHAMPSTLKTWLPANGWTLVAG